MPLSNQVDWLPTQTSVDAALATAVGADFTVGTTRRVTLYSAGMKYDGRFNTTVNSSKGAWLAATQIVHDDADHAARYAESLVGAVGPPLTFDPYSNAAIIKRIDEISGKTSTTTVKEMLAAHAGAVAQAYSGTTAAVDYFAPLTQTVRAVIDFFIILAAKEPGADLAALARRANVSVETLRNAVKFDGHPPATIFVVSPGLRTLELELLAAIAAANEWLALIGY